MLTTTFVHLLIKEAYSRRTRLRASYLLNYIILFTKKVIPSAMKREEKPPHNLVPNEIKDIFLNEKYKASIRNGISRKVFPNEYT